MIKTNSQNIRLHKYLSEKGFGSRRSIEKLISIKKIFVNNKIAILGQKVSIGDKIKIQQSTLVVDDLSKTHHQHLIYNKPEGEICSKNDPGGRKTTFSALPRLKNLRWISIGRLDINTSGLLLFTTDGTIANQWMHPSNGYEREYMVRIYGKYKSNIEKSMINGINLSDGMAKFKAITQIQDANNKKWFKVTVDEGRNRFIKRMFEHHGIKVSRLIRIRFGDIILPNDLKKGQYKIVSEL